MNVLGLISQLIGIETLRLTVLIGGNGEWEVEANGVWTVDVELGWGRKPVGNGESERFKAATSWGKGRGIGIGIGIGIVSDLEVLEWLLGKELGSWDGRVVTIGVWSHKRSRRRVCNQFSADWVDVPSADAVCWSVLCFKPGKVDSLKRTCLET